MQISRLPSLTKELLDKQLIKISDILIGYYYLYIFISDCKLNRNSIVLDVGCGRGRLALPLLKYLGKDSKYYGFDVRKKDIDWCKKNISRFKKNFVFNHFDLHNGLYCPNGKISVQDYKFPYDSNYFDFIFLISVFTHLLPDDLQHYLSEISRVLKKDGTCIITFYLLNIDYFQDSDIGNMHFLDSGLGYYTTNLDIPEAAVEYDETNIRRLLNKNNLEIVEPIYYGEWQTNARSLHHQDHIIVKKICK